MRSNNNAGWITEPVLAVPEGELTNSILYILSSRSRTNLNLQGADAGLNISFVEGSDDLSITVDGEEWFRLNIIELQSCDHIIID